jgi:hypothetical protein
MLWSQISPIKPITRRSRNPTRVQPYTAISLRTIRRARAEGKATARSISTMTTLARNISKKTASVRTQRNEKNRRKSKTRSGWNRKLSRSNSSPRITSRQRVRKTPTLKWISVRTQVTPAVVLWHTRCLVWRRLSNRTSSYRSSLRQR